MNHHRYLLSQTLLKDTAAGILLMFGHQCFDSFTLQGGKYLDVFLRIVITNVQPELIERIRCCAVSVQPNVTVLRLAKLFPVSLRD